MDQKIIINYQKHFGETGTCYNQTIKINQKIAKQFNQYIREKRNKISGKILMTSEELGILRYAGEIDTRKNSITFLSLTMLDLFMKFYLHNIYEPPKRDKTYERILWRNSIIKVI